MRVLLFGATGMVGQGVLRECLLAADVQEVVAVGRTPLTQEHGKLHQVLHSTPWPTMPVAPNNRTLMKGPQRHAARLMLECIRRVA